MEARPMKFLLSLSAVAPPQLNKALWSSHVVLCPGAPGIASILSGWIASLVPCGGLEGSRDCCSPTYEEIQELLLAWRFWRKDPSHPCKCHTIIS